MKYGDERMATLITFIVNRNQHISDDIFTRSLSCENMLNTNNSLRKELQSIKNKLRQTNTELQKEKQRNHQKNERMTGTNLNIPDNDLSPLKPMMKSNIKELIAESIQSKKKQDKSFIESGIPLKSLNEHLYDNLRKRFGVTSIVNDTMDSLLVGMEMNESSDIDIFVFNKIFHNKLNEEFFDTIVSVRVSLQKTLYEFLKLKYKSASQLNFDNLFKNIMRGEIGIKEAQLLLFLMYKDEDAIELCGVLTRHSDPIETVNPKIRLLPSESEKDYKIKWSVFEDIVLRYVTMGQLNFVSCFTELFRDEDKEVSGKITDDSFRSLMRRISELVEVTIDVEELLIKLDPANTGLINYSPCLSLLMALVIEEKPGEGELSVLALLNKKVKDII